MRRRRICFIFAPFKSLKSGLQNGSSRHVSIRTEKIRPVPSKCGKTKPSRLSARGRWSCAWAIALDPSATLMAHQPKKRSGMSFGDHHLFMLRICTYTGQDELSNMICEYFSDLSLVVFVASYLARHVDSDRSRQIDLVRLYDVDHFFR